MNALNKRLNDAKTPQAANSNAGAATTDERYPVRPDSAGIAGDERPAVFDRLHKAVARMQGGIDNQKAQIAITRANMVELDVVMRRIEWNLHAFRREIGNVKIKGLQRKAMRLAGIVKRAEARI